MAYEFPDYDSFEGHEDLDALTVPQFEDIWSGDRHETPEESEHKEQEFLAPEPINYDFPETDSGDTPDDPDDDQSEPDTVLEDREPASTEYPDSEGWDDHSPYPVQPGDPGQRPQVDPTQFESPDPSDVGNPQAGETPSMPFFPWAYPLGAPGQNDLSPSEYGSPGEQEDLEPLNPIPPGDQDEGQMGQFQAPPPMELQQGPSYEAPLVPPIQSSPNEDLFARVGWPVAAPRIASTFWYM